MKIPCGRVLLRCALILAMLRELATGLKLQLPTGLLQEILIKIRQDSRHEMREEARPSDRVPMACPSCGMPLTSSLNTEEMLTHNPHTCRLVNLVLREMGVGLEHQIRVEIYPGTGPLGGFYTTVDPYTIHISDDAYTHFPEYIIFHETKHLADCLTKGWSEEGTPDNFARSLCVKYGYRWPPPQQPTPIIFNEMWF